MIQLRPLFALIASDYRSHYSYKTETPFRRLSLFLPRVVANPSLHATILLRLNSATPPWWRPLWRNVLLTKHSFDVDRIEIGPGLVLPHPWGIVIGAGAKIGRNCAVHHNVTLGAFPPHQRSVGRACPVIGDNVVIFCGAMIVGPVTVGDRATIGAYAWVDRDVPPGAVVPGGTRTVTPRSAASLGTAAGAT